MAKDRARPFSRKHRRYWFTVTGGMLLIGALNVAIGMCAYEPPREPERIIPVLPPANTPGRVDGSIGVAEIPAPVMRAFAIAHPRHIPTAKKRVQSGETLYELSFTEAGVTTRVTYFADGTPLTPK